MWKKIKNWYHLQFVKEFTIAADISPFYHWFNERERLFHIRGLLNAKCFCHKWVWKHPNGQARILEGNVSWNGEDDGLYEQTISR
jgi:hypothetical protein